MSKATPNDASASAAGYLYQCRYALLAGLRAIQDAPELELSIEKFDDVAFESAGDPVELIQTKHHVQHAGALSDASSDLWRTLLIWCKRVAADIEAPFRTTFVILTTAAAPPDSAASYLRVSGRNEAEADKLLLATAQSSKNVAHAEAYGAYKGLPQELRLSLLKAIRIIDRAPNILDVRDDIASEVYHAAPRGQVDSLVERLEGWWFNVVISALVGKGPSTIPVLAIDQRVDELREAFKREALPVDFKLTTPPPEVVAELDARPFVQQLRKIAVGRARVEYAIRDYYRASEQRSRWAREDLLLDGEIAAYEQELVEAWQPRHAANLDVLTPACTPARKMALGQQLFAWVEQEANFPLRGVRDRFLTHGSFQILSNRFVVGWHPEFKNDDPENDKG